MSQCGSGAVSVPVPQTIASSLADVPHTIASPLGLRSAVPQTIASLLLDILQFAASPQMSGLGGPGAAPLTAIAPLIRNATTRRIFLISELIIEVTPWVIN